MKEKMEFKEFTKEVTERIKEYLPEEYASATISLQNVRKNNDLCLTGLAIKKEDSNICPNIYLEKYYGDYVAGTTMDELLSEIADFRIQHELSMPFDVEEIINFERVKDKIIPRLVNAEMNKELLPERPHKFLLDLAITYCIVIDQPFEGNAITAVTNNLMETWGKNVEELHEIAINNFTTLNPSIFKSMTDMLADMMGISAEEMRSSGMYPDEPTMYVLSNSIGTNGATALLDTDKLNEIEKEIGEFYILPSSIHEVIILPKKGETVNPDEFESMVKEVNATQVQAHEQLGEHVYTYSSEKGLTMM